MSRKRHAAADVLSSAIGALELPRQLEPHTAALSDAEDRRRFQEHRGALLALLSQGPLFASDALLSAVGAERLTWDEVELIRAELLAFLRGLVRRVGSGDPFLGQPISLYEPVNFAAAAGPSGVVCAANGDVRDLIVLQVVMLVQQVGIAQLRLCSAPDCDRLFVKTYRREYCSVQCQKRVYMRDARNKARINRQERERRNRRRRGKHGRA